ncbi:MAG: hypothetical protein QM498_03785 [Desulfobacterium sp.]
MLFPLPCPLRRLDIKNNKIVSAEEVVRIIRNNATVAFGGFVGIGFAEEIAIELERFFLETGHPKDLSPVFWWTACQQPLS